MHQTRDGRPRPALIVVPTAAERQAFVSGCRKHPDGQRLLEAATILQTGIGLSGFAGSLNESVMASAAGLVSLGTAGAIAPNIEPGTLLLPAQVRSLNGVTAQVDAGWHAETYASLQREFSVVTKDILYSEEVVQTRAKQSLFEQTGAIAVDMESGVVARLAQTADIPFLIVRTVLDPADQGVPPAAIFSVDRRGRLDAMALIRQLATRPFQLTAVIRLAMQFRRAARTLRSAGRIGAGALLEH